MERDAWSGLISAYQEARRRRGRPLRSLRLDRRILRLFQWFLSRHQGATYPQQLTRHHLEAWEDYLRRDYRSHQRGQRFGHRIKCTTWYGWVGVVLGFLGFLVETDRLVVDPRIGFERGRHRRTPRDLIPTEDEVARFLDAIAGEDPCAPRDRALFELLYSTALRTGEACRLDLYDVDLAGLTVTVRQGKGGYDRVVPLGRAAARKIAEYLKKTRTELWKPAAGDALFLTRRGNRIATSGVGLNCQKWATISKVTHVTSYKLRHACATHLLRAGADVRHVQECTSRCPCPFQDRDAGRGPG